MGPGEDFGLSPSGRSARDGHGPMREASEGVALIGRMAGGDRQAFGDFYDRYATLAFTLIRRIVGQPADAEEVLQEVFWQAWRDASAYDEKKGSPEAWILNRARSRAIDKLRSIRRKEKTFVAPLIEEIGQPPQTAANPGSLAEDRTAVQTALGLLPERERRIIELAFFEGLTQSEIALRLGEPLGTIKTRMRSGLEWLRGHFQVRGAPS